MHRYSEISVSTILSEYQQLLLTHINNLEKKESLISSARLLAFLFGVLTGLLIWMNWGAYFWFLEIGCIVAFIYLLACHDQIYRNLRIKKRQLKFIQDSEQRRSDGNYPDGPDGSCHVTSDHPFAFDLNLIGKNSLFSSLCIAKTKNGHELLAKWLLNVSPRHQILCRAESVKELQNEIELRLERIGLVQHSANGIGLDHTIEWSESSLPDVSNFVVAIAVLLAITNSLTFCFWLFFDFPLSFFLPGLLFSFLLYGIHFNNLRNIIWRVRRQGDTFRLLSFLIKILSRKKWNSSLLIQISAEVSNGSDRFIRSLGTTIDCWQARMNQLVAPFAFLVLWDFFFAKAILIWHRRHGRSVRKWIHAIAQFEALDSLAHQTFLFPENCFPCISDSSLPFIVGNNLSHPLIPFSKCVKNHVEISYPTQFLIISGSNMSGKSTYMRTVGINAALALAGGSVHASKMTLTPLQIVATLQIQDSLHEGLSRFGAELARLRQIIQLSHIQPPLLFFLDEIFSGTNSRDRFAGAKGLIKDLISRSGIGMVTTHDLALAEIVQEMNPLGKNGHFVEQFDNGCMTFDYKFRPGVVVGSNALGLMKAIGVNVTIE